MFLFVYFISAWSLKHIDLVTAKTTVRLWHELHVSQKKEHDFQALVSPHNDGIYFAAIRHDEIKSIAFCKRADLTSLQVTMIAHPPEHLNAPVHLLTLLRDNKIVSSNNLRVSQPKWYYESMFHK